MKSILILSFTVSLSICIRDVYSCHLPYLVGKPIGFCEGLKQFLVNRTAWKGQDPSGIPACFEGPVDMIILHHTGTPACTTSKSCAQSMRKMQINHMKDKKWMDIGYHFVLGGDGLVYEGRPWYKAGAHTKFHNKKSIGIAFIGDFDKDCPDPSILDLIPKIAYCGVEKGFVAPNFRVVAHKDVYCTSCPGDALYDVIKKWPRFPKGPMPSYTCDVTEAPKPETTTMTATTTTEMPTTTTTTAAPPTTEPPTTTEAPTEKPIPIYYYVLLPKGKLPWFTELNYKNIW